ncbi:MAG: YihY/virulence factor BrkB family protein [Lachnospiraceae bacterium]|nr:YihY/virulence factor BrkB family protein [Lachnospiraceae bacterium]MBQ7261242.1 YihY/virulence factor BrkB family protein [Lachnospiraceae bacterium]HAV00641.1 hypothetical protein [Lachnospiraceae bacterium]
MKKICINIYKICKSFFDAMRANHVDVYSASAAYYLFISSVPFILALFAIIPFTPLTEEMVVKAVSYIFPSQFNDFAVSLIYEIYDDHFTILSIAAITAIWSASRGLMSIRRGFDEIYHIMEPYNYVIIRLKSSIYTLLMILIMTAELIFGAFGQYILELLDRYFPDFPISGKLGQFYTNLAFTIGAFVLLVLLYSFLPRKKQRVRSQLFGALVATAAMFGFSKLFSVFLSYFMESFSMYGSLATVVILLLWLYVNMYIIFIGAQLNSIFADKLHIKERADVHKRRIDGDTLLKAIEEEKDRAMNPQPPQEDSSRSNLGNLKNIINFKSILEKKETSQEEKINE